MHTIDLCFPFCLSLRHAQLDKFLRRKQLDVLRREEVRGDGKGSLQAESRIEEGKASKNLALVVEAHR
jgi:hypothetical protein